MASISTFNIGIYAFNAQVVGLQSQTSRSRSVKWYLNGTYKSTSSIGLNTTVSPTATFSNLSANTSYTLSAEIYWSSDNSYITTLSTTVKTNPVPDSTPPTVNNIWCSPNQWTNEDTIVIGANIVDTSGIKSANLNFNGVNYSYPYISGNLYSWRVPTPTTYGYYSITIGARDNNDNLGYGNSQVLVGLDKTKPTITYSNAEFMGGGIRVNVTASDVGSGVDYIYLKISSPNSNTDFSTTIGIQGTSGSYTFTTDKNGNKFVLNNKYYVELTAKDYAGNYSDKVVLEVKVELTRPALWTWQDYELNAFKNKGAITTLTYKRWNAFIDNVKGVVSWYHNNESDFLNLESAKMSESKKQLLASDFNKIKNAIGGIVSTGITDRQKGDKVLGEYFITLSTKLNLIQK